MKKIKNEMNDSDKKELFKRALEESLGEQIRMVPPKEEIEKEFVFSKAFEHEMEQLIKKRKRKKSFVFIKAAACILLLLGVGYTIHFMPFYNSSSHIDFVSKKEGNILKKEERKTEDKKGETSIAADETDEDSFYIAEKAEENSLSSEEDKKMEEKKNTIKKEEIPKKQEKKEETDGEPLEMAEDKTDISKTSVQIGENIGVVSQLVSAVMEGASVKVIIQIENQTDTSIICESASSIWEQQDGEWVELSDMSGTISNDQKEVLAGETYEDTIVFEGFSMEEGKRYKLIKMIAEEQKEIEFEL